MKKLRAWHKSLIAILVTIAFIAFWGSAKQLLGLILIYILVLATIYFIERKKTFSLWQERLIVALIVFPLLSFFIPVEDVLYLFSGSLIFTVIIFLSEKWKDKDEEILPEWEGETLEKETHPKNE